MDFISYIATNAVINGVYFLSIYPQEEKGAALNWSFILNMIGQFFFLIIIFIAIILMAVFSLRITARFKGLSSAGSNLRVMETKALGGGNFVHLVKAGNKYLVLGSSKENVNILTELSDTNVNDTLEQNTQRNNTSNDGFRFEGMLSEQFKRIITPKEPPNPPKE